MLNDPLANMFSKILNYERTGKKECTVHPASKLIRTSLNVLQDEKYVGGFEVVTEARGGTIRVNLLGNINKCGVVKPRFNAKMKDFERFEKRYLPGKGMGIIIVSTSKGIMTLEEARKQNIGGRLLGYCY